MKAFSVWKEVEIYKEALKKICSMMYAHDPPSPDYMSDTHQLEECCRIAGEALDYVRGYRGKQKPCVLKNCIHEGLETCRLHGVPVSGASWCEKYQIKIDCIHEGLETCKYPVESVATFCLWKCEKYEQKERNEK